MAGSLAPRTLLRQAAATGAVAAAAAGLAALGWWATRPEGVLILTLALAPVAAFPRRPWHVSLAAGGIAAVGLGATVAGLSPVIGAGLAGGVAFAWLAGGTRDALELVAAGLLGATAAGCLLAAGVAGLGAEGTVAAVALPALAALGMSVAAWTPRLRAAVDQIPSRRQVRRTLAPRYQPPVLRALDLYHARGVAPDRVSERGLGEVTAWTYRLALSLQALDDQISGVHAPEIGRRIAACEADSSADAFVRERLRATVTHLRALLDHRAAMEQERVRTEAMVGQAVAFLEEARAGIAVGRRLPGEGSPDRLDDVLRRLRTHAAEGEARRRAARELEAY